MPYKKWSRLKGNAGVQITENPVCTGVHCPMHTALSVLRGAGGISSLVVGMPECCCYSRFVVDHTRGAERHYTYILEDSEVVFGCSKGVEDALRTMAKEGCAHVLVIRTCIPSLIGEDLEQAAKTVTADTGTKIQMIDAAHYKRNGWMSGVTMTLSALGDFAPALKKQKLVYQLGEAEGAQWQALCQILRSAGYQVQPLLPFEAAKWTELGASCCNLICSSLMEPLAERLYQRFGTESVRLFAAVDEASADSCYEEMERILKIALPRIRCQAERPAADKVVSTVSTPDAQSLALILSGLGIQLTGLHMEEAIPWPGEKAGDPEVFFCPDSAQHGETALCLSGSKVPGREIEQAMKYIGCERIDALATLIRNAQGGNQNAAL